MLTQCIDAALVEAQTPYRAIITHASAPLRRPWIVKEHNDACFIVKEPPGRRSAISISKRSPAASGLA